jgi:subtilisin family serine protease
LNGENPNPKLKPDILVNSYGCPTSICGYESMKPSIDLLTRSGTAVVASAGNSINTDCSTIQYAPGIYENAITVGATQQNNNIIMFFSSRGPSKYYNLTKPNFMAPGVNIISSTRRNSYGYGSGTSMSCPHIAGSIALLWSKFEKLHGNVALTKSVLERSSLRQTSNRCSSNGSPNNEYGFGSLNLTLAYDIAEKL